MKSWIACGGRRMWMLAFLIAGLTGCGGSDDNEDLAALISAANRSFESAFQAQSAPTLAGLYTTNGSVLPPGSEPVVGAANIQNFWQAVMNAGIRGARLTTNELTDCGDTAVEVGSYELLGSTNNVLDRGKYVVVWRRENGQWRLHRDIFNTSVPAT